MEINLYRLVPWATSLLIILLVLPNVALGVVDAAQQPIEQARSAQYGEMTNIPGEATPTAISEVVLENPFPSTVWMTDTVRAVAGALARGENLQVEQQPAALLSDDIQSQEVLAATHRLFLPIIRHAQVSNVPTRTPTPSPTPSPTSRPDPDEHDADVGVGIWPNPSVQVGRGGVIAYEVRVTNFGRGRASSVRVKLPQDPALMQVYGSTIPNANDRVSEKTTTSVTLTFGPFGKDEQRTATLFFRLKSGLADGSVIPMRASYEWSDSDNGGAGKTNAAPVRVGAQDERSAWALFNVSPTTARAGSNHTFTSDRFAPGEGVSYWLNMPNGSVKDVDNESVADSNGFTSTVFRSANLAPGNYSMVGQGRRSGVVVVGFFTVTS